jgi:hypothetical protein
MKIIVAYSLTDIDNRDFRNRSRALDQIDEACALLKRNLQDDFLVEEAHEKQRLDRLIRFCHTGK